MFKNIPKQSDYHWISLVKHSIYTEKRTHKRRNFRIQRLLNAVCSDETLQESVPCAMLFISVVSY